MKNLKFYLLLSFTFLFFSCSNQVKNVFYNESASEYSCNYKNTNRKFVLCLPEVIEENETPLIIMLHGLGGDAGCFMEDIKFHKEANSRGYGVVFVSSMHSGWDNTDSKEGRLEESFLLDLASYLQKKYKLNKKVLFAGGFSNGAFMCHKLGVSKKQKFTAVVSVAGMMPKNVWGNKSSKCKTGLLQINGTKDDVVPMKLTGSDKYNPNPAIEEVIEYYAKQNKLYDLKSEEKISHNSVAVKFGKKVWFILSQDTFHAWPKEEFTHYKVNDIILEFLDGFWR